MVSLSSDQMSEEEEEVKVKAKALAKVKTGGKKIKKWHAKKLKWILLIH